MQMCRWSLSFVFFFPFFFYGFIFNSENATSLFCAVVYVWWIRPIYINAETRDTKHTSLSILAQRREARMRHRYNKTKRSMLLRSLEYSFFFFFFFISLFPSGLPSIPLHGKITNQLNIQEFTRESALREETKNREVVSSLTQKLEADKKQFIRVALPIGGDRRISAME